MEHYSVLKKEAINYLIKDKKGIYVDGTLGAGGHSLSILKNLDNDGFLYCFDLDDESFKVSTKYLKGFSNYKFIKSNNSHLRDYINSNVDGVLLDLGLSSMQ
ncbi:MAG: 16S rRNA (cytosine(1402)-N(4))-methyltransferase, partial [Acholeplasmatales bacterium]|nr:16S rRNA (cytosine(1402)-N(4))-methyltransferase [Acholeplasmatales bacterium]